jgi:hypothetical protein
LSFYGRLAYRVGLAAWLLAAAAAGAATADFAGFLYNENTKATFDVFTEKESLDLTFTYPAGSDFRILVLGQDGNKLGDFTLKEGPVITLTGGGKFTLVVYSERGGGPWTAYYEP